MAGFSTATDVPAVNGVTPPGNAVVVIFVTSSLTFAPTAAVPRKSPFMSKLFVPSARAFSRVNLYPPPSSVTVALRAFSLRKSLSAVGSTAPSFCGREKQIEVSLSALSTPVVVTNALARFTLVFPDTVAVTFSYEEPAPVVVWFSSVTHFTFATQPSHALAFLCMKPTDNAPSAVDDM